MEIALLTPDEAGMLQRLLLDEKNMLRNREAVAMLGGHVWLTAKTGIMILDKLAAKVSPLLDGPSMREDGGKN